MARTPVGIVAVLLLAVAGGLYLAAPAQEAAIAICVRAGLIMGALWVALADKPKPISGWRLIAIIAGAYLFLRVPRPTKILILVAAPALVLLLKARAPKP